MMILRIAPPLFRSADASLRLFLSKPDVSGGGMDLQRRSAAVQRALRRDFPRPVFASFRPHPNSGEIRMDVVTVGHVNRGAHVELQLRRQVDGDVARGRLKDGFSESRPPGP